MTRRLAWRKCTCPSPWQKVRPGDRLYVRENFAPCDRRGVATKIKGAHFALLTDGAHTYNDGRVYPGLDKYADGAFDHIKWSPSIHMPRWASRLTLEVTATKIEKLQEISEADALAEGVIEYGASDTEDAEYSYVKGGDIYQSAREAFKHLWLSLHGPESWDANPELVAPSFTVHKHNIDSPTGGR